jgi:hypothetical protein
MTGGAAAGVFGTARQRGGKNSARALVALVVLAIASCAPLRDYFNPSVPSEWAALLGQIKDFERSIGFETTDNFLDFAADGKAYFFCGRASPFVLPYSYQDPAIRWREGVTEAECKAAGEAADTYFGRTETLGEIGAAVTPAMTTSKLDRFLYLVIHEDCHDQFDLPYGIEEPLCNLLTYKAMAAFSAQRFRSQAREDRAIRRYADTQSDQTHATRVVYGRLESLYGRYERKEITPDGLLRERSRILVAAQRSLAWRNGTLNNIGIAADMTYSRHYPFLESVFDALGRDLGRSVAFFRHVDAIKPSRAGVLRQHGNAGEDSLIFIRAYEVAIVETIRAALVAETGGSTK